MGRGTARASGLRPRAPVHDRRMKRKLRLRNLRNPRAKPKSRLTPTNHNRPDREVRIDKWLWCVRLYKSRTLAAGACEAGKVRVGGQAVKPSRALKEGDLIEATTGEITRTVKVLGFLEQRVGARKVPEFMEDVTPPAELQKKRQGAGPGGFRPKGTGRPTKRDRRILQSFFE
jgi:ribosome-associated heat shock protein Hsp15